MLIFHLISGTHRKDKRLGYVAEFCPTCRGIEPFKVSKYGLEDYILFIPLGMKEVLGHEATCTVCQTKREVDPTTYQAFVRKPGIPIEVLADETFPSIRRFHAGRLRLESELAKGTLTPAEREFLIMEVFQIFNKLTEVNFRAIFRAKGPGMWLLGLTVTVPFILLSRSHDLELPPEQRGNLAPICAIVIFCGILTSVVLMVLEPRRTFRKKILPAMASALRPLDPTQEELATALEKMKLAGCKIAKKTTTRILWNTILHTAAPFEGFTSRQTGSLRQI